MLLLRRPQLLRELEELWAPTAVLFAEVESQALLVNRCKIESRAVELQPVGEINQALITSSGAAALMVKSRRVDNQCCGQLVQDETLRPLFKLAGVKILCGALPI